MKNRILFVIESLTTGGAEKSLVTLLSMLDYSKYDVDLQLFSYGGEFQQFVPKEVNILPCLEYFNFASKSITNQILSLNIRKLSARIGYSISLRRNKNLTHPDKARLFWQHTLKCFTTNPKEYDIAIAYGQGVPTFYVVDKIKATKKYAWVNASLNLSPQTREYNIGYYSQYTKIVPVSSSAKNIFAELFPLLKTKLVIIKDIVDANFIERMSAMPISKEIRATHPILLTVSRLNNKHKGMDIALNVCKILRDKGIKFKWHVVGEGAFRGGMEQFISDNNLSNTMTLLGSKANPYPYYKACTLYVQTSRHEGFGLSIAEARILNKPVVTTEFDAVWNQMVQGKNGVVVPQNPVAIADAIEDLLTHPEKREAISEYQRNEKKGNPEELEKFYRLIEE